MTAAVLHFPATPAAMEAARKRELVAAARAILRRPDLHSDCNLLAACAALQDHGDATDHLLADVMLDAIKRRARSETPRDVVARTVRTDWRKLVGGSLVAVAVVWAMLMGVMA